MNDMIQLELEEPIVDYDSQSEFTDDEGNHFVQVAGRFELAQV